MKTVSTWIGLILLLLLIIPAGLFAQNRNGDDPWDNDDFDEEEWDFAEPYGLGTQMFTMNAGLLFPLFVCVQEGCAGAWDDDMYALGGTGSLAWQTFLTSRFSLGMALSGSFSATPSGYLNVLIPFTGSVSYLFRQGAFEFPVSLDAGIVINRLDEQVYVGPILRPGGSAYWLLNHEWALGFNLKYWWVPEIYFGDRKDQTGYGNFLEFSFSARYTF